MAKPFDLAVGEWWLVPRVGNSRLSDVYPTNPGGASAANIIDATGGATFDSTRKDLLITGGGSVNYAGNEVYAFGCDPAVPATFLLWRRKTFPSTRSDGTGVESYADGTPSSSALYSSVLYDASRDRMVIGPQRTVWGTSSISTRRTYSFDCSRETPSTTAPTAWTQLNEPATWPQSGAPSTIFMYDPIHDKYWDFGFNGLARYTPSTNTWSNETSFDDSVDGNHQHGIFINSGPGLGLVMGHGVTQMRLLNGSPYTWLGTSGADWGMTGDDAIEDAEGPGMVWDPNAGKVFAWGGLLTGGTDRRDYYEIDLATNVSTRRAGTGAVPTAPSATGYIFGRFAYVGDGLTCLVNSTTTDVYFLRVSAAAGGGATFKSAFARSGGTLIK